MINLDAMAIIVLLSMSVSWPTGLTTNRDLSGSFMAINRVVLDNEHGFSFGHKKAPHIM
jgi:hypothetical protein